MIESSVAPYFYTHKKALEVMLCTWNNGEGETMMKDVDNKLKS